MVELGGRVGRKIVGYSCHPCFAGSRVLNTSNQSPSTLPSASRVLSWTFYPLYRPSFHNFAFDWHEKNPCLSLWWPCSIYQALLSIYSGVGVNKYSITIRHGFKFESPAFSLSIKEASRELKRAFWKRVDACPNAGGIFKFRRLNNSGRIYFLFEIRMSASLLDGSIHLDFKISLTILSLLSLRLIEMFHVFATIEKKVYKN